MVASPGSHKILGIDPGSRIVGYALIEARPGGGYFQMRGTRIVDVGVMRVNDRLQFHEKIGSLHDSIHELVKSLEPGICVFESSFVGLNARTAMLLGHARGALISGVARCQVPVAEITPAAVKRCVAGNGRADKEQVAMALKALLGFDRGPLPYDACDALAVALAFSIESNLKPKNLGKSR